MPQNVFSQLFRDVLLPLLSTPSAWVLIILAGGLLFIKKYSRYVKGIFGEKVLSAILRNRCGEACIVFDDITLAVAAGDTTQVDHIVISPAGIFIIETKCYQGLIYGRAADREWTQKIFRRSYRFQNPFRQNYKHVKAVQAIFPDIQPGCIHSLVLMSGGCRWAGQTRPALLFTSGRQLAGYISDRTGTTPRCIDVDAVSGRLREVRLKSGLKTRREPVRNLRHRHR
ncbi:TPA: NERD domain-containing protein [Klebsiella oxytoca]|uniref:NERD domain-containing protein n=1 Tax=Klebsiella oxytoca TaxID=571 RepID=A0AAN5LDU9_KLEOX|nr:NERD domain-containing protein [Klebsiella oxytoca]